MGKIWSFVFVTVLTGTVFGAEDRSASRQQSVEFTATVKAEVPMNYLLYLPPNYEDQADWPLLVFLHGAGERGDDLTQVQVHGPPKLIEQGKDFPMIVVSPQCESRKWWQAEAVAKLVDNICGKYKVDRQRIYLTGLSMGGYGTWATLAAYPRLFAAAAPVCGGGDPAVVDRFRHVPIWVFHGAKDPVVPLKSSEEMVDALKAAGADVKFTVYPEAEHDSWTETYDNPAFYEWLLEHARPDATSP